jgi:hypothetical protein
MGWKRHEANSGGCWSKSIGCQRSCGSQAKQTNCSNNLQPTLPVTIARSDIVMHAAEDAMLRLLDCQDGDACCPTTNVLFRRIPQLLWRCKWI